MGFKTTIFYQQAQHYMDVIKLIFLHKEIAFLQNKSNQSTKYIL